MQDDWGIVPLPMGPRADQYYWTVQALNTTLILANAQDPEALAALRAFLWRKINAGQRNAQAAMVEIKPVIQASLDDLFGH